MSHTTLRSFDKKGLFILPHESEEQFVLRMQQLGTLSCEESAPSVARKRVQALFDVDPSWVKVCYSDDGLYPWEGGCTWYDDVPWIQMRKTFATNKKLYGIYDKDEVLAHEYVHAVRASFKESCYEEFFAYLISNSFRASIGPIFQKPSESLICVILFCIAIVSFVLSTFGAHTLFWSLFLLCSAAFGIMLAYLAIRLCRLMYRVFCTVQHLSPLTDDFLWPLMIRLSDEEITLFSSMTTSEICHYVEEKRHTDLRWSLLFAYCKNCALEAQ